MTDVIISKKQGVSIPRQWHFVCTHCRNALVIRHLVRQSEHDYNKEEVYLCVFCASGEPVPRSAMREFRLVQLHYLKGGIEVNGIEVRDRNGTLLISSPEVIKESNERTGRVLRSLHGDKNKSSCPLFEQGVEGPGNVIYFPENVVEKYHAWKANRPQRQSANSPGDGYTKAKCWMTVAQMELLNDPSFWSDDQYNELDIPIEATLERGKMPFGFERAYLTARERKARAERNQAKSTMPIEAPD